MSTDNLPQALRDFLTNGRVALDIDLYTREGGPGLEAYIRDILILAWRQGYKAGHDDLKNKMIKALAE